MKQGNVQTNTKTKVQIGTSHALEGSKISNELLGLSIELSLHVDQDLTLVLYLVL